VTVIDANSIENTDLNMYIIIGVVGGILVVVGVAVLTFFLIKKKSEARKKIDVKTIAKA
jgi:flagellar basal body-associated protein FliL